jgi:hypothetical protein
MGHISSWRNRYSKCTTGNFSTHRKSSESRAFCASCYVAGPSLPNGVVVVHEVISVLDCEATLWLSIHSFQFAIIFLMLYLLTALPFFLSQNSTVQIIIFSAHLLCMLCLVYCFYFVSKSLVIAEKGEAISFNDYALSLLFSLLGIWLIQP